MIGTVDGCDCLFGQMICNLAEAESRLLAPCCSTVITLLRVTYTSSRDEVVRDVLRSAGKEKILFTVKKKLTTSVTSRRGGERLRCKRCGLIPAAGQMFE